MKRSSALVLAAGSAWLLLGAIEFVSVALSRQGVTGELVYAVLAMTLSGFFACVALFWVFGKLERRLRGGRLAAVAAVACLIASAVRAFSSVLLWHAGLTGFLGGPPLRWQAVCASGLWGFGQLGLCSGLYFAVRYWLELQEQKEKTLRASALAHQARLQMLRYQLNPHFLFNALNSIRAMVLEDAAKSRQMITRLSDLLRYSLDGDSKDTTIGGELNAIRGYLEIEHIRFEHKLHVTMEVDPAAESLAIPSFLIHPLVENAIQHGMETTPLPLKLEIRVARADGRLQIRVRNTGRLLAPGGTGTGLRNVVQRLELGFPGRHSFDIHEQDGWVIAAMDLVLREQPA